MWDKVRKALYKACEIMELLMVAAVICGIVVAVITLWPELLHYWNNRMSEGAFLKYLDAVFNVVIGIEFMKMLCRPYSATWRRRRRSRIFCPWQALAFCSFSAALCL